MLFHVGGLLPEKVMLEQDTKWLRRTGAGGSWEEAPGAVQRLQQPRGASMQLTRRLARRSMQLGLSEVGAGGR